MNINRSNTSQNPIEIPKVSPPTPSVENKIETQITQFPASSRTPTPGMKTVPPPAPRKVIVNAGMSPAEKQQLKKLSGQVAELETKYFDLRDDLRAINYLQLQSDLKELTQVVDKKATILDIKKATSSFESLNLKLIELSKTVSDGFTKFDNLVESNESFQNVKKQINTLDKQFNICMKSISELTLKYTQAANLKMETELADANSANKVEALFNELAKDLRYKFDKLNNLTNNTQSNVEKLAKDVEERINSVALRKELQELESIFVAFIIK